MNYNFLVLAASSQKNKKGRSSTGRPAIHTQNVKPKILWDYYLPAVSHLTVVSGRPWLQLVVLI